MLDLIVKLDREIFTGSQQSHYSCISEKMNAAARCALLLCLAPAPLLAQSANFDPNHAEVPFCKAGQMSLATDNENGTFNGMSHAGTLLVLRNLGPAACKVEPFAQITFLDGTTVLQAQSTVSGARFLHPGPVVFPVVVAPFAEVTTALRWVSGEVYSHNNCIKPTAIAVKIGDGQQQTAFAGQLCSEAGKPLTFEMTRLATDPVYTGK